MSRILVTVAALIAGAILATVTAFGVTAAASSSGDGENSLDTTEISYGNNG